MKKVFSVLALLVLAASLLMPKSASVNARPLADTYTSQPDGTAGIDATINSEFVDTNYGTNSQLSTGEVNSAARTRTGLLKFDLSSIPANAIINSATLSLIVNVDQSDTITTVSVHRLKRNWTEDGATWNKYDGVNSWATPGGLGATDIDITALSTLSFASDYAAGTQKDFSLSTAEVKSLIDGTNSNYGFLLTTSVGVDDGWAFYSSDDATSTNRPKLVIDYSIPTNTPTVTVTPTVTDTPTVTATPTATATPIPWYLSTDIQTGWATSTDGVTSDTYASDDVKYSVVEGSDIPGFYTGAAFENVPTGILLANFEGNYTGNHSVVVKCNETTIGTITQDISDQNLSFVIPESCVTDGGLQLVFDHVVQGNVNHTFVIDHLYLEQTSATETPTITATATVTVTETATVTETPTVTVTPTITLTPTSYPTWNNPPTPAIDNTISYGDIAQVGVNMLILAVLTLALIFYVVATIAMRKRG